MQRLSFLKNTLQLPLKRSCNIFRGIASKPAIQSSEDEEGNPIQGRRWLIHENLILIAGKANQEKELAKVGEDDFQRTGKEKWEEVAIYCQENGVHRNPQQCRDKWQRIIVAFSRIKDWEVSRPPGKKSYWAMKLNERNAEGLSFRLDKETFNALDAFNSVKELSPTTRSSELGGNSSVAANNESLDPSEQTVNPPADDDDDRPALIVSTIFKSLNQLKHMEYRIFQNGSPCNSNHKEDGDNMDDSKRGT